MLSHKALVLDTHVWLWLVEGDARLSPAVRKRIEPFADNNAILVPVICVWEVAMLWKRNRIQLQQPINSWVRATFDATGFSLVPLNDEISLESALLPGDFHSDPADRMIVATARVNRAIVASADRRIVDYGAQGHVEVLTV